MLRLCCLAACPLIAKNTPRAERGRAMGIWIASSASTTAIGPFLGGFLLTYGGVDSWRLIFALNIPIGLLALILLSKHVPRDEPSSLGGVGKLDWTGAGLLTIALALLASGLTFLAETSDRNLAVSLLLAGLVFSVVAVWWELRAKDAMIDMGLFRLPAFTSANIVTFLIWSCMGAVTFFLPMLVIVAWKLPASYAGSMFLPFSGLIATLSPLSGRLVDRFGARLIMSVGSMVFCIGCLSFAWAIVRQDFWTGLLPSFAIIGLGIGLIGPTISTAVINSVPENRTGAASGINNMLARGFIPVCSCRPWCFCQLRLLAGDSGELTSQRPAGNDD